MRPGALAILLFLVSCAAPHPFVSCDEPVLWARADLEGEWDYAIDLETLDGSYVAAASHVALGPVVAAFDEEWLALDGDAAVARFRVGGWVDGVPAPPSCSRQPWRTIDDSARPWRERPLLTLDVSTNLVVPSVLATDARVNVEPAAFGEIEPTLDDAPSRVRDASGRLTELAVTTLYDAHALDCAANCDSIVRVRHTLTRR